MQVGFFELIRKNWHIIYLLPSVPRCLPLLSTGFHVLRTLTSLPGLTSYRSCSLLSLQPCLSFCLLKSHPLPCLGYIESLCTTENKDAILEWWCSAARKSAIMKQVIINLWPMSPHQERYSVLQWETECECRELEIRWFDSPWIFCVINAHFH